MDVAPAPISTEKILTKSKAILRFSLNVSLNIFIAILNTHTVLCAVVLHFLCWSAESWISGVLTIVVLASAVYFHGFGCIVMLAYQAARYFSFLLRILEGILRVIFIFALYEIILNLAGYHSEDYQKLKHSVHIILTESTSTGCMWYSNMTTEDGSLVLETNDFVNLCGTIWNMWYAVVICVGLYIGMPEYTRVKKDHFWQNLYLAGMLLVVWKAFENFLWFGWWHSVQFHRVVCLYVYYIRNGEDGFKSVTFTESPKQGIVPYRPP